jgi:uncharacterized protein (DUF362 family)
VEPTTAQVEAMVRRAVTLTGGLQDIISATARVVLLKPNLVRWSGQGIYTDPRVVRAVALLVHEVAPAARIIIGEGPGSWVTPDLPGTVPFTVELDHVGGGGFVDGFERSGYRDMARELREKGIDVRIRDLNFDRVIMRDVPGGHLSRESYAIAASVLEADAWINVPVAKTHGSKITCAMKNPFGILPGRHYGWNKSRGTLTNEGIPHSPRIIDETFVDLLLIAKPDFVVVDMLAGSEGGAFGNTVKRANIILAGAHPVATDLVAGKLMGFNPDDLEFAELAARRDEGPGTYDAITVIGGDATALTSRWVKAGGDYHGEWSEHANYGKGPRRWTFFGPVDLDHEFSDEERTALHVTPGEGGWSSPVWFGHDRIDLDRHYDDPVHVAVYAHTRFTMPRDDEVRFWLGADDRIQVWIDGASIYQSTGARRLGRRSADNLLGQVRLPGQVQAGEHDLLIRIEQRRGPFEFSFNICEAIDDIRFAGNTYAGLRYHLAGEDEEDIVIAALHRWSTTPGDVQTIELGYDYTDAEGVQDSLVTDATPALGNLIRVAHETLGLGRPEAILSVLEDLPFGMAPFALDGLSDPSLDLSTDYGPASSTTASWLGFDYWVKSGLNPTESQPVFRSLMSHGDVTLRSAQAGWVSLGGYRQRGDDLEIRLLIPGMVPEWEGTDWWWWTRFDEQTLWRPIAVLRRSETRLNDAAIVDSLAVLALEMARLPSVWMSDTQRGETPRAAGLAAWDEFVRDWEQQPLTQDWAVQLRQRQLLARLRSRVLSLADGRRRAAALFQWGATQAATDGRELRGAKLTDVAQAYGEAARILADLGQRLPAAAWGPMAAEDRERAAKIEATRPLLRQARDAERQALATLAAWLAREPLPAALSPVVLDRIHVLTLSADRGNGTHYVTVAADTFAVRAVDGSEERLKATVYNALPEVAGWRVELEQVQGGGAYRVVEQPSAANHWTAGIHVVDSVPAWSQDGVEVMVWAVRRE